MSPPALCGAKKLLDYFIDAARTSQQYFVAGPVWNQVDRLVAGETQYMRYAFGGMDTREVAFSTVDLEKYGAGDADMKQRLEQKVFALLGKD